MRVQQLPDGVSVYVTDGALKVRVISIDLQLRQSEYFATKNEIEIKRIEAGVTVSNQIGHEVSFRFKKNAAIGEPNVESDGEYLAAYFVDTGDYDALADVEQPQRIVVGRIGVGKSALISYLRTDKDHVIEISPENLSLNYLCNSDVVPKLEAAGVRLDIFYGLLWKHVLAVELLRRKYQPDTEG